ncbi:hypothetical protein M409DRAFT_59193 [Zasmidium cellare ATCC 36951]|uniref:Uncharacterized protein n=1 Tax=Zasmidium cellare ATCC 36951 TaxID=1080233 RepID=A0A6A6C2Z4_ZASCE|nr:uncharacterized protein M409DRAFT_59193 [Zasmidium cellare ATCC 36951]KAF2161497.1 hypothetical protein M409DRAFT_59193 [Zasmidium cellare ATCC 36951]
MPRKSFSEAAVVAIGAQTSAARFGGDSRHRDDLSTPICPWRCNLTALSQHANLYFVAYADRIFVYRPRYHTQALSQEPALIVTSQPSTPARPGYIDARRPHAINNLVVQCLGSEEIIATVRDDGDVDAFFVRQIIHAIERRAEPGSSVGVDADEVKPFFQSNVGMSAWGLAIHSEARILATSANTHSITIFKFGLVDADGQDEPQEGEELDESGTKPERHRKTDVTEQVLNGTSNIPHIAFCNTGDDPEARWLLTTDIGGFCRSIDLWEMATAQTFRFGGQSYVSAHDHDRFNSGWTIMFLDKRSFLPEDDFRAALGFEEGEIDSGVKSEQNLWDIGGSIDHVPDASERFGMPRRQSRFDRPSTSRSSTDTGLDGSPDEEVSESAANEDVTMADPDQDDDELSEDDTYYVDIDSEDEGTEDSFSFNAMYGGRRIFGNEPRAFQFNNKSICDDLPCPILHSSVRSVYLVQPPHCPASEKAISESAITPPTVGFTNALRQLIPSQYSWINSIERLNMTAYIPAIGVVVLASQKGRVVVMSLTKLSRHSDFPALKYSKSKCPPNTVYTMRIERILPFASQEADGHRPFEPLAGIATGPMQGTEHLPDEQKRWRLMLMYYDHTVLSYEVRRRRMRDSGVSIQDVVV